ncbi:ThuA domain-containing protein [Aquirufa aurantiipilula]|uniref:ThuA domain-containing protein n=1 Tax=Aquirufa aurantiipilula TaxID=2696561 RepID=A0ABT6BMU4_9BACT|nr:ThuA domain-containing protein [Aquirufa aurantiipilula]MDF5691244.1 ThuA domain-containing protein [Aquirufa aurantiipilula]
MKKIVYSRLILLAFTFATMLSPALAQKHKLKNSRVLVYTKNGVGYVHDNIPSAVACIKELGVENKFTVDVSDDPNIFTEANLKKYTMLIFTSTNNDVFATDEQRVAFRRYIEAGGGFVGVHSVTGTERKWAWFKMMVGETFTWHANFQPFSLINIDPKHPSMEGIPAVWTKEDECYFGREMYPGIKVLMMHDVTTLDKKQSDLILKHAGTFGDYFPAVWYQNFQGGHVWVTTLGHAKTDYQNPMYRNHLLQGIKFIANQYQGIDYSKAISTGKDDKLMVNGEL